MPATRITMRKIRDILRLRLSAGLSIRGISRSTKISVGGIQKLLSKAKDLRLAWNTHSTPASGAKNYLKHSIWRQV